MSDIREGSRGLLSDTRYLDAGLTREEAVHVIGVCRRFMNRRDELEDLYQTALVACYTALESAKTRREHIVYRKGFVHAVVVNALVPLVRRTQRDLLYKSANGYEPWSSHSVTSETSADFIDFVGGAWAELDEVLMALSEEEQYLFVERFILCVKQTTLAAYYHVSQPNISERCRLLLEKVRRLHDENCAAAEGAPDGG